MEDQPKQPSFQPQNTPPSTPPEPSSPPPQPISSTPSPVTPPPSSQPGPSFPAPDFGGKTPENSATAGTGAPTNSAFPSQPLVFGSPKKKRKGLMLGIIIAAVLVVLGGGGAFAYTWYQTPERVITDSVVKAMLAKSVKYTGTVSSDSEMFKLKVELNGSNTLSAADTNAKVTVTFMDKSVTIDGSARFDVDGNVYTKLNNLDTAVKTFTEGVPPEMLTTLDKIVAKINNQWVKITPDNLATVNPEAAKTQKCMADTLKKYQNDKDALRDVANAYDKNKFIKVSKELGQKDGNLGYELTADKDAAKNFMKAVEDTKIFKDIKTCNPDIQSETPAEEDTTTPESDDTMDAKSELWVNMWTHEIYKVSAEANAKDNSTHFKTEIMPQFNQNVTITPPENAVTFEQLQSDIDALVKEAEASAQAQAQQEPMMLNLPAEFSNQA